MVPWQILNTFSLPILIWAAPRALALYRSLQSPTHTSQITPLPRQTFYILTVLLISAAISLLLLTPPLSPLNIFTVHPSNGSKTSTSVLLDRLSQLRPLRHAEDHTLRSLLPSKNARLLHHAIGPETLTSCAFCNITELDNPSARTIPLSYLIYQLPSQMLPHIFNLLLLGLATSSLIVGLKSSALARLRTPFLTIALALAGGDIYMLATYDVRANSTLRPGAPATELDFFHWRLRTYRFLGLAAYDVILAGVLYLTATNRLLTAAASLANKVTAINQVIEVSNGRLWAVGVVRNSVARSRELRGAEAEYWEDEADVFEERTVVDAVNGAVRRVNMREIENRAAEMAVVVGGMMAMPAGMPG